MLIKHKKLQPMHCYHIFSNSMVVYLAKIIMAVIPFRWYRPTLLAHGLLLGITEYIFLKMHWCFCSGCFTTMWNHSDIVLKIWLSLSALPIC